MVWRYRGERATHKIWSGFMQRFLRNLSLWTTDACAMTVAKNHGAQDNVLGIWTNSLLRTERDNNANSFTVIAIETPSLKLGSSRANDIWPLL